MLYRKPETNQAGMITGEMGKLVVAALDGDEFIDKLAIS